MGAEPIPNPENEERSVIPFTPEGVQIHWGGPGLETRFYDPRDLFTLFHQQREGGISILLAERFIQGGLEPLRVRHLFWSSFLSQLIG